MAFQSNSFAVPQRGITANKGRILVGDKLPSIPGGSLADGTLRLSPSKITRVFVPPTSATTSTAADKQNPVASAFLAPKPVLPSHPPKPPSIISTMAQLERQRALEVKHGVARQSEGKQAQQPQPTSTQRPTQQPKPPKRSKRPPKSAGLVALLVLCMVGLGALTPANSKIVTAWRYVTGEHKTAENEEPKTLAQISPSTPPVTQGNVKGLTDEFPESQRLVIGLPTVFRAAVTMTQLRIQELFETQGNVSVGQNLSVSGDTTLQGGLTVGGNTNLNGASITGPTQITGSTQITGATQVNGATSLTGPVNILGNVQLSGNITALGSNINLGTGTITASNLINSLTAGTGISLGGTAQNPTIANTDPGSAQKIFNRVIVGSSTLEAGSNTDALTLVAGSGVTLTPNTSDKRITIDVDATSLNTSGFTDGGTSVYLTTITDNLGLGTNTPSAKLHVVGTSLLNGAVTIASGGLDLSSGGITNAGAITGGTGLTSSGTITFSGLSTGVVKSSLSGVLSSSAVDLASADVTGVLPIANGGTGITSYTQGDILYANGSGALTKLGIGSSNEVLTVAAGVPTWATITGGGGLCSNCLVTDPGSTQVVSPTSATATGLSVRQASGGSVDIFNVTDSTGSTKYFTVDSSGNVSLGSGVMASTGVLTVTPANTDPIAISPVAQGVGAFTGTITSEDLTTARTWTLPNATGTFCLSTGNCNGQGSNFGGSGTLGFIPRFATATTVENSIIFDDGTNIGINDATPSYRLDVNGTGRFTGALTLDSTLNVTGITTLSSTLQVTGGASFLSTLDVTGATTLSSTLGVTGAITAGSTITASGDIAINEVTPTIYLTDTSAGEEDYYIGVDGNTFQIVNSTDGRTDLSIFGNGTFNIGHNSQAKSINIAGSSATGADVINIGTSASAGDTITIGNSHASTTLSLIGNSITFDDGNLSAALPIALADTALNGGLTQGIVDAINDLYDMSTSGGGSSLWSLTAGVIHPTSATNDFVIGGSTLTASMFGIDESAGNFYFGYDNSANPTLLFEATDGDAGEFGFNTNDSFYFSNANVGIGTTSPGEPLSVEGATTGLSFITQIRNTSTGGNLQLRGTGAQWVRFVRESDGASIGGIANGTISSTANNLLINGASGVGLGAGTSYSLWARSNQVSLNQLGSNSTPSLNFVGDEDTGMYSAGADTLNFATGGAARMTIASTGNVGIGTTAPDRALEINSAAGTNLRLTYNDSDGSATNYADFTMTSGGDLTIAPSGGDTNITGTLDVSGHAAFGASASINSGSLIFPSSTYSNILSLQEQFTSALTSVDYVEGITNYLALAPTSNATAYVYAIDNYVSAATNFNYPGIYAASNAVSKAGTGTLTYGFGSYNSVTRLNGAITNAYGSYNAVTNGVNNYAAYNEVTKSIVTAGSQYGSYNSISNTGVMTTGTENNYGIYSNITRTGATGGTLNTYGAYINMASLDAAGAGTHTAYGLYLSNVTGADTNYAIYSAGGQSYFAGNVGLGATTPTAKLQFAADTAAAGGILFGTDTNLYRYAADTLRTDDSLIVGSRNPSDTLLAGDIFTGGRVMVGNSSVSTLTAIVDVVDQRNWSGSGSGIRSLFNVIPTSTGQSYYGGQFTARDASSNTTNITAIYGLSSGAAVQSSTGITVGSMAGLTLQNSAASGNTVTTNYGILVNDALGTGTITTNYGIYIQSMTRGGTNYSLYSAGGNSYFAGNVGVNTLSPTSGRLQVTESAGTGVYSSTTASSGSTTNLVGLYGIASTSGTAAATTGAGVYGSYQYSGSGTTTAAAGGYFTTLTTGLAPNTANNSALYTTASTNLASSSILGLRTLVTANNSTGTVGTLAGVFMANNWGLVNSGTLTNAYGIHIGNISNSGTISNTYGVYIGDITTGTQTNTAFGVYSSDTNALNYFGGRVAIGPYDTTADYTLELSNTTGLENAATFGMTDQDIAHGMLNYAQTDAFGQLNAVSLTVGGLQLTGLTSDSTTALQLRGFMGTTDPEDDTPAIDFRGAKKNGVDVQALANEETVLQFSNNTTALLTVKGSGRVGIGDTTPDYLLHVSRTGDGDVAGFTDDTGTCTINPTNTALSCSSDLRLKKNVATISNATDALRALRGVNYKWNSDDGSDPMRIGFIAQEVEAIVPQLVTTGQNGFKSVNYVGFVPILTQALKEQDQRILGLNTTLEAQAKALSSLKLSSSGELIANMPVSTTYIEPTSTTKAIPVATLVDNRLDIIIAVSEWSESLVTFLKDVRFKGKTFFEGTAQFLAGVNFKQRVTFEDKDMAGLIEFNKNEFEAEIAFETPFTQKPIITLTAEGEKLGYILKDVTQTGFKVELDKPVSGKVMVHWQALAVTDATTVKAKPAVTPSPQANPEGQSVTAGSHSAVTPTPSPSTTPSTPEVTPAGSSTPSGSVAGASTTTPLDALLAPSSSPTPTSSPAPTPAP